MPRTGRPASRHVAGVRKAIDLLDTLADAGTELGTNELARRTGINPSTVSRLLATLVASGLAEHVPATGRYRLGLRLLQLGNLALRGVTLRELARPHLDALAALSKETVTLSAPGEREALTIDFVQSPSTVRSVASIGRSSVLHATATGKVMLAWGKASQVPGRLHAYTEQTITDPDVLTTELGRTRERGWAQAVGEREEDLNAIAVPVLDRRGHVIAIVGIQGPATRFTPRAMRAMVEPLGDHAARLGAVLSHQVP